MNRRALLSRLPLLAALPWLAPAAVRAAAPAATTVTAGDWWPPGDGWMIYEASVCFDQWDRRNSGRTTKFARHVGAGLETVSHFEPGRLLCRRLGERKP